MSFVQNALENVAKSMSKQLKDVATKVATDHNVSDVNKMVDDLMVAMGLMEIQVKTAKTKSVKSDKDSVVSTGKKRVVSKKMKDAFLALEGANDDLLKELIKEYKTAEDVESFDAFSRAKLGLSPLVKETKPRKEKKEKKEKKGRFDKWNPTSTKLFKTITEENSGIVTDDLKKEFQTYIDGLSDEHFASASIQGHMRAFSSEKSEVVEEKKEIVVEETNDDEDLLEFDFEDETLLRGEKTGKIYRSTEEAGDVLIGYAGKGRFSDIK
jgi:hypothetical protein